ncbi:hypothetical protein ISCGN_018597 [Ixodes scapularis]
MKDEKPEVQLNGLAKEEERAAVAPVNGDQPGSIQTTAASLDVGGKPEAGTKVPWGDAWLACALPEGAASLARTLLRIGGCSGARRSTTTFRANACPATYGSVLDSTEPGESRP